MSTEVAGVKLASVAEPLAYALEAYRDLSRGRLDFDVIKAATTLELTPDKPNSARSVVSVTSGEKSVGDMYVIAFQPGDGTGDESFIKLHGGVTFAEGIPISKNVLPRQKAGVATEVHLPLFSQRIDDVHAEPELFGGNYDLLGLRRNLIKKIGELGHQKLQHNKSHLGEFSPFAMFTVGTTPTEGPEQKRFGDPHSVYVPEDAEMLSFCAFLAVSDGAEVDASIFEGLSPQLPRGLIV